jgi:serine protease
MKILMAVFFLSLSFFHANTSFSVRGLPQQFEAVEAIEARGLIVDFKNDVTEDQVRSLQASYGIHLNWIKGFKVFEKLAVLKGIKNLKRWVKDLSRSKFVESVEPNYVLSINEGSERPVNPNPKDFNDPFYPIQWHMAQIGVAGASKMSKGEGAIVAVVDTGVAYENHSDFRQARDLKNTRFIAPHNFLDGTDHANDDHGHGTHVAGTIAQSTNNKTGVVGIAPGAQIMPLKVLDGSGRGTIASIAEAIKYAADHGAHIINMSLGGPMPSKALRKACKYALSKGALPVCAAGNSGKSVGYPAKYPECMAVSAVQYDESITFYSSRGPEIEIAAPGGNIRVDQNKDGYPDGVLQNTIYSDQPAKDDYMLFMGTSMAAPHVAGAAALLVSAGVTHPERLRSILKESSRAKKNATEYGSGLLDVENALKTAVVDTGWYRLFAAFILGLLCLKRRILSLLHPLSLLGILIFGSGFFPAANFLAVDSFSGNLCRPLPEWDLLFFGVGAGNPIFRSALWALILTGFCFHLKAIRPFLQGAGFGLAGFLLISAMLPSVDLAYVPEVLSGEFLWYLVNAGLACFVALHSNPSDTNS